MSLWNRIKRVFGRGAAAETWPPINEDWQAGDLAECIVQGSWARDGPGPDLGDVHRVVDVIKGRSVDDDSPGWGLKLSGYSYFYNADCFRKVQPRADALERCEADFLPLVRPVRVPATREDA